MPADRLKLLYVSVFPPSPARFGAQRRIEGLMKALARRHELTALALASPDLDAAGSEEAMREYCRDVVVIPSRRVDGLPRRLLQARSLASRHSFLRNFFTVPALQRVLDDVLSRRRFDLVNIETPVLAHYRLGQAPSGAPAPKLVLDNHNIEHDLVRQMAGPGQPAGRRAYYAVEWRKLRREEIAAWRRADGVTFTSALDQARARAEVPTLRSAVVANAVDCEYFRPAPEPPAGDRPSVLFFGAIDYLPNRDGILWFVREIWPLVLRSHPAARLEIVGPRPPPEVLACRGPGVDVTGPVEDLRPRLAAAAVTVAPLRIGGGTRLKIVEAMASARPVVSTTRGAEGIDVVPGRDLLLADEPAEFASAVGSVLADPGLAARIGRSGRALVEERYSWTAGGDRLEAFFREVLDEPYRPRGEGGLAAAG